MANTKTQWKPFAMVRESINTRPKAFRFSTYTELKKNVKSLIEQNTEENNSVTVFRSRRGEWGEWFEKWMLNDNGNPVIYKQGWM